MPTFTWRDPVCGREWTGTAQAHCSVCHEHFSTVANFDKHKVQKPPRKCKSPGTHTRTKQNGEKVPLLKAVNTKYGPLWVSWSDDEEEADD